MNSNLSLTRMWDRSSVKSHLENANYARVLDVGGARTQMEFADKYVSHILDIVESEIPASREKTYFIGDCCKQRVWDLVFEDVEKNGKFDFVICTHTLEDLTSPSVVVENMAKIGNAGYIAIPSKYAECIRREGNWRGYFHHRWVFDANSDNDVIALPKINAIDHIEAIDHMYTMSKEQYLQIEELQFFWSGEPKINFVEQIDSSPTNNIFNLYQQMSRNNYIPKR